ncbi:H-NS histone family protein [Luteimonas yindakuii]|uniref:H-NS histone family protein n=1 Tax=Luteimonas yindakuii TaxID=2565782 RepID=A0A4Z1RH42_9GAMM|nr:H-NS histone family protein [Luteimonas yindakuii]QCO66929.1 H-NS histone family protein [Luteimonas yindakuii]TKS52941.1 H-NS histone family protein [Luteimonas yindakuii]
MAIDLNTLSPRELESLIAQARKRKTTLQKRKPVATVRRKVEALLKAEGYTAEELFGAGNTAGSSAPRARKAAGTGRKSAAGRKLGKVAPKYRNPANKDETWTGRGKHPRWMAAELANGKKVEDFLIQ